MEDEESDSQKLLQILIKRYNLSIEDVQELSEEMTKTQYYDMSIIMRQALILAVDKGILTKSPFDDVVINTKMFRSNKKKNDATQVFLIDEQVQIEQEALADFEKNGYPASIAVALCFQMGLRIGEMAVVKWSDIDELQENYMHIQRMEVKRHKHQTNGTWKCNGYEIVDHVKSDAGDRNVYLTKKAKEYLAMVRKWNEEHGFGDSEYIFLDKQGHNIHSRALDTRI